MRHSVELLSLDSNPAPDVTLHGTAVRGGVCTSVSWARSGMLLPMRTALDSLMFTRSLCPMLRSFAKSSPLVALAGVAVACTAPADTAAVARPAGHHPRAPFVGEASAPASEWRLADRASGLPGLAVGPAYLALGVADGTEEQVFGEVSDLTVLEDGRIAVLDALSHDLRLFSSDGVFLQRLGGAGAGPGELRSPQALAVAPSGDIVVADMQRRLTRFARGDGGYSVAEILPLELSVRDLCFLRDTLIVHALTIEDAFVLRRIGQNGQIEHSFGTLYASPNPYVNLVVAQGRIACDDEAGLIYVAPRSLMGEVRAYRPDGTLVWRARAPDFVANQVVETPDGYTLELSPTGVHALHTLVSLPGRGVLVQYSFRSQEELRAREPARADITAILSQTDGSAVVVGDSWPLIGAVKGNIAAAIRHLPFPQVSLLRLPDG